MTASPSQPVTSDRDPADGCLPLISLGAAIMIGYVALWFGLAEVVRRLADGLGYTTSFEFNLACGGLGLVGTVWLIQQAGWLRRLSRTYHFNVAVLTVPLGYVLTRALIQLYRSLALLTLLPTCQDLASPHFLLWGATDQENIAAISQTYFVRRDSVLVAPDPWRPGSARLAWTTFRASYLRGIGPNGTATYSWWTWRQVPAGHDLITRCVGRPMAFALADDSGTSGQRRLTLYFDDNVPVISGTFASESTSSIEDVAFDRVLWAQTEILDDPAILAQLMGCDGTCGEPNDWIDVETVNARLRATP